MLPRSERNERKASTLYIWWVCFLEGSVRPIGECADAHPCVRPYTPSKGVYGPVLTIYDLLTHS